MLQLTCDAEGNQSLLIANEPSTRSMQEQSKKTTHFDSKSNMTSETSIIQIEE